MNKEEIVELSRKIVNDLIEDSKTKKSDFFTLYKSLLKKYNVDFRYYNILLANVVIQVTTCGLMFENFDELEFLSFDEWYSKHGLI